jgi:hypothetical protein
MLGKVYRNLTILETGHRRNGRRAYLCSCICGNTTLVTVGNWNSKTVRSCGCLNAKVLIQHKYRREYSSYRAMLDRCTNTKNISYKYYGGRGITVCERWRASFNNFLIDLGERPVGCSLERKENSKNYEPGNCKWATSQEQATNKRPYKVGGCRIRELQISS